MYWRSALAIAIAGIAIALVVALKTKRAWRSETTVLYRDAIQTGKDGETSSQRAARLGPKLKDMVDARPRLAAVISEFGLFPQKAAKSMVEAVEEMQQNIGFRARNSDTFVISFVYEDPAVAQRVVSRLAELMIADYSRESLDSATMTRDFLQREVGDAEKDVDEASRALATFLAQHPQFQWGLNDSPYAPTPNGVPGAPPLPGVAPRPIATAPPVPVDPQVAALEQKLASVEGRLAPAPQAGMPAGAVPPSIAEAQKRRDAAATDLATAQGALTEKLQSLTPAHPDAVAAKARVAVAQQNLAAADSVLRLARAGVTQATDATRPREDLTPDRRAALERERASLRRQIADRRAQLGPAGQAAPASSGAKPAGKQDVVELETDWHRLRLELDRARDHLRMAQANERTAGLSADAAEKKSQAEMMILEPAYLPTRPDRGRGRVFFAGVALALFIALAYAGTRVLLNDVLYDDSDVEALGGPPMLVAMPRIAAALEEGRTRSIMSIPRAPPPAPEVIDPTVDVVAAPPPPPRAPTASQRRWAKTLVFDSSFAVEAMDAEEPVTPYDGRSTVRFGSPGVVEPVAPTADAIPLGSPGAQASSQPNDANGGAERGSAPLVLYPGYGLVTAVVDEPEFEVIGSDIDAGGMGVLNVLRSCPTSALAALRVLRHRLDQHRGDGHLVVSVVSASAHEGKTTLAIRLAMTLSESERARVVLIEGNLERPRVASALGLHLPEDMSLSAQIRRRMRGNTRPWGLVRLTPTLSLLAERGPEALFPAALHSTHFDVALRTLRRHFDYVVIDGPSVLGSGDANVLEDASDSVVVVARSGHTKGADLSRAAEQLGDRRIIGVVLNDVSLSKAA